MRQIKKRLGEMLIESGLLSEEQLEKALSEQRGSGIKLGDFLITKGFVAENDVINLLSKQLLIEKYDANRYEVGPELAEILPNDIAKKHQLVPLEKDTFLLKIAMVDPMDLNSLDLVEKITNMEVEPVICSKSEFSLLINGIYGIRSAVSDVLEDLEEIEVSSEDQEEEMAGVIQDIADAAPVIRLVNSILRQAIQEKASDIHISPEQKRAQVRLRIDGKLHEIPPPPHALVPGIISRIKILANMDIANTRTPQDGRFSIKIDNQEINLRASTLPTIYGENLVMRLLYVSAGALPLKKLGLLKEDLGKILKIATQPYGMLLSVGPTGSGKSSTLYAILNEIITPEINIITLEDPVEFRMENVRQVQLNRKAGMTFASGLRSILRQDPDVIMVGEIRDNETAGIAVQSALTGHLVLSTLHTNDSTGSITRLQNMEVEPFLISASLLGACAQRLLRRVCDYCAEDYTPSKTILDYWGLTDMPDARFRKAKGCSFCMNTGYKGRTGIYEIMMVDDAVREMIIRRASSTEIANTMRKEGKLKLLKDVAALKIAEGMTTFEEAGEKVLS